MGRSWRGREEGEGGGGGRREREEGEGGGGGRRKGEMLTYWVAV